MVESTQEINLTDAANEMVKTIADLSDLVITKSFLDGASVQKISKIMKIPAWEVEDTIRKRLQRRK